jgi:hypothetical protein
MTATIHQFPNRTPPSFAQWQSVNDDTAWLDRASARSDAVKRLSGSDLEILIEMIRAKMARGAMPK